MKKKLQPQLIAIVGFAAAGVLVLAVGWFMVVSPERSKIGKLRDQIDTAQTELTVSEGARATPVAFRASDLFRLAVAMPGKTDMPGILLNLRHLADRSSVTVLSIRPSTPVPFALGYSALPLSVNIAGTYESISKFLGLLRSDVRFSGASRLETGGRLFAADNVSLAPAAVAATQGGPTDQLSATLSVDAFVYSGPPATPPATQTSTTGSTTSSGSGA